MVVNLFLSKSGSSWLALLLRACSSSLSGQLIGVRVIGVRGAGDGSFARGAKWVIDDI
jgi:hypothetical protein